MITSSVRWINRKKQVSMPSCFIGSIWHKRPPDTSKSPTNLVWHPRPCSKLVQVILIFKQFLHIHNTPSTAFPIHRGVPQGSVLGPLLFTAYTTQLSHLLTISILHHLYSDDTQLFISFSPKTFQSAIEQLQKTTSAVSNWTSSNLLCLNQSKSEFMITGLPAQLANFKNHLCQCRITPF
jgi:hypothetical protein